MLWISFPAGHNSLHLPIGLSNWKDSSLPHDPTCLTDLRRFVDFSAFYLVLGWRGGEGNGNPLWYSCLENSRDRGSWWTAVYGVTQSRTRMKQLSMHACIHWRRKWQPTPVLLPGESQGQRSLLGCCLWGRTESDTTDVTDLAAAAE